MSRKRIGEDLKPLKIVGYPLVDACAALGISARTMRRLRESGQIKAIFIEKCALIPPRELDRALAKGVRKYRSRSAREEHPPL